MSAVYADSEDFARRVKRLTRKQVVNLLEDHHASLEDFDADFNESDDYKTADVLAWLGY